MKLWAGSFLVMEFFKQPLNLIILVPCVVVTTYFGIKIYNEVRPKSLDERKMECLKLGSDVRAAACLTLVNKNEK